MGGGYEKLGNIATFAEVNVDRKSGDVEVVRVVTAFECGAIVNPDGLRNQIEGSNVRAWAERSSKPSNSKMAKS